MVWPEMTQTQTEDCVSSGNIISLIGMCWQEIIIFVVDYSVDNFGLIWAFCPYLNNIIFVS